MALKYDAKRKIPNRKSPQGNLHPNHHAKRQGPQQEVTSRQPAHTRQALLSPTWCRYGSLCLRLCNLQETATPKDCSDLGTALSAMGAALTSNECLSKWIRSNLKKNHFKHKINKCTISLTDVIWLYCLHCISHI